MLCAESNQVMFRLHQWCFLFELFWADVFADKQKLIWFEMLQSIIYYTVRSTKLETWLENESIRDSLRPTLDKNYVDLDPTFASSVDEDYDHRLSGVSKNSFTNIYIDWIQYCAAHRDKVDAAAFDFVRMSG